MSFQSQTAKKFMDDLAVYRHILSFQTMITLVQYKYHDRMIQAGLDEITASMAIGIPAHCVEKWLADKKAFMNDLENKNCQEITGAEFDQMGIFQTNIESNGNN